jgi:uncharacterized protein YdeI (YjbR/CyaY-like superfamily)
MTEPDQRPGPTFFAAPADLRAWLEAHHDTEPELLVGFHKVGSGRPSITWPESVDQALCYGWIDGVRKSIDGTSYTIRFTPRKPASTWSVINIRRARELMAEGLMRPAGRTAFESRADEDSGVYSYEQRRDAQLDGTQQALFQAHEKAWSFFQEQPPWYRKAAAWWVISAKREETRSARLATLVECSERGQAVPPLTRRTAAK